MFIINKREEKGEQMPTCKFGNNFGIKCFPRRRSIVLNMICVLFFTVPSLDRLSVLPAVPPIVRSSDYKCVIAFCSFLISYLNFMSRICYLTIRLQDRNL